MKRFLIVFLTFFPIFYCYSMEEREEVIEIIPEGAHDLNMQLIDAVMAGDEELILDLLDQGADSNTQDSEGNTPLLLAVSSGLENVYTMIHYLIEGGAAPSLALRNQHGVTPLMMAINYKDLDSLSSFIKIGNDKKIDIGLNSHDNQGNTPLTIAIDKATNDPSETEDIEDDEILVRKLIQAGAHVDLTNNIIQNKTPLMVAVIKNNPFMVDTLLGYDANPNLQDMRGSTPLLVATAFNSVPMVSSLLKHNANPNIPDNDGNTPLLVAFANYVQNPEKSSTKSIILQLLFKGANPDLQNKSGIFARMLAPEKMQEFEKATRLMKERFTQ